VEGLLKLLSTLEDWIAEFPPVDQPQRFGNKAFRDWFEHLKKVTDPNQPIIVCDFFVLTIIVSDFFHKTLYIENKSLKGLEHRFLG